MPHDVSLAAPHELLAALRLLFPDVVASPHATADAAAVFVARDASGCVCAAVAAQSMAGALGLAWPPRAETPAVADALAEAAGGWLRDRGVKVCQAFAGAEEAPRMTTLERHGFRHVTRLVFLRRETGVVGSPRALAFEEARPPLGGAFRNTLLATHEGTLDCPELNGDRTADELLAAFDEPLPGTTWHLAQHAGDPVGVVVLATGEKPDAVELTYLGVVPAARGRGFGRELVAFALVEAVRRGAAAIAVSVDARNEPALALYRRQGFTETGRRDVWLAHFSGH